MATSCHSYDHLKIEISSKKGIITHTSGNGVFIEGKRIEHSGLICIGTGGLVNITGSAGQQIFATGRSAPNDGAGGHFAWDASATHDGGIVFGRWRRIFSGPIDPVWYGAVTTGLIDGRSALQTAIDTAYSSSISTVSLSPGTTLIGSVGPTIHNNMRWGIVLHDGVALVLQPGAVLKADDGFIDMGGQVWGAGLILANSCSNVNVYGPGVIDMNGANNLVSSGSIRPAYPIMLYACSDFVVDGVTIKNNPGLNGIIMTGRLDGLTGRHGRITNNVLINGGTSILGNVWQNDYSGIYCDSDDVEIAYNAQRHPVGYPRTYSGGIEVHGSRINCHHNYIERSYPGAYIAADLVTGITGSRICDNTMSEVQVGIIPLGTSGSRIIDCELSRNVIGLKNWITSSTVLNFGIDCFSVNVTQLDGIQIEDNVTYGLDNNIPATAQSYGMRLMGLKNALVRHNTSRNLTGNPYILSKGSGLEFLNVTFRDNVSLEFGRNSSGFGHGGYVLCFSGATDVASRLRFVDETCKVSSMYGTGTWCMFEDGGCSVSAFLDMLSTGHSQQGMSGTIGSNRAVEVVSRPIVNQATPNVDRLCSTYNFANTTMTTVTNFLGGSERQNIQLELDANTIIQHSTASIYLKNQLSVTGSARQYLTLQRISGFWYETGRSF